MHSTGASPDMKRYLYAKQQLAAQGKYRVRTWPKNSTGCSRPASAPSVGRAPAYLFPPRVRQLSTPSGAGRTAHDTDSGKVLDQATHLEWAGAQHRAMSTGYEPTGNSGVVRTRRAISPPCLVRLNKLTRRPALFVHNVSRCRKSRRRAADCCGGVCAVRPRRPRAP